MAKVVLKFNPNSENQFDLDDNDIVTLDSLSQSTPDASGVNYGCIASTGSVSLIDYNGNIAKMIESGELPVSNMGVDVFFNGNKVQSHITTDSSYDENTKELTISLSNTIKDLSSRTFSGYRYPEIYKTAYDLLYIVMNEWFGRELGEYSEFRPMLSGKIFHSGTSRYTDIASYLGIIRIQYPVIEPNQTFATVINQICELAQIQMFVDADGTFKFISARPVDNVEKLIHIPVGNIVSEFKKDVFLKNKYKGTEIGESVINIETKFNENIYKTSPIDSSRVYSQMGETFHYSQENVNYDFAVDTSGINILGIAQFKTVAVSVSAIKGYYLSGGFEIPIKTEDNLQETTSVYNKAFTSEGNPTFTLRCVKQNGSCSCRVQPSTKSIISTFNMNLPSDATQGTEFFGYPPQQSTYKVSAGGLFDVGATSNVKFLDSSYISATKDESNGVYLISYKILVGQDILNMGGKYNINSSLENDTQQITVGGPCERYVPVSLEISVFGVKKIISFSQTQQTFLRDGGNQAQSDNIVSLTGSKLLSDETKISSNKISEIISDNILNDYAEGIKTATVTVVIDNYYDSSGNKIINKDVGELIKVGDIVEVEGQKNKIGELIKWRVTGSKFKYDGEPLQELELMELVFTKDGRLYYLLNLAGNAYQVQADNDQISGSLILGGTYDNGETGPLDVISVSERGFYSCKNITEVVIKDKIGVVFDEAFAYSGITQLIINTEVDSYASSQAFSGCESLKKVYLLGKCYSFTDYCFDGCSNLSEMYIGKNLTFIGNYALINCPNLKDIYYEGTEEDWNKIFIYDSNNNVLDNLTIHYNSKVDA